MSTLNSSDAAATRQQQARNLIAAMVRNSDLHGVDDAERDRQLFAEEEEDEHEDQQPADEQRPYEDADSQPHEDEQHDDADEADPEQLLNSGEEERRTATRRDLVDAGRPQNPHHKDQVQAAFENYGQITDAILNEWKELFSLFDFDNTGFIKTDDLGTVLRGLGRNLTEAAIATFINSYDGNGSGKLDFPTFYRLMIDESPMPGPCYYEQVMKDFAVFDMYKSGELTVVELVHLLRNLGEPLTRDDVDNLLREIYIDGDNKCNIKALVQHMFATSAPNPE